MKSIVLLCLCPLLSLSQPRYIIHGKVEELRDGDKIYLSYRVNGIFYEDSTIAKDRSFVKAAYERYRSKNFTVLGVSIDDHKTKAAWIKAFKEDGLPWAQVLDPSKKVHDLYGVTKIPANFLIDPNGKIVAKNLRDRQLTEKLAELLDK